MRLSRQIESPLTRRSSFCRKASNSSVVGSASCKVGEMLENLSLWRALRKLSGKDMTIIKLRVLYDNSFKEIGKVLGMTEGAVRKRYNRAIKLLRDTVEE